MIRNRIALGVGCIAALFQLYIGIMHFPMAHDMAAFHEYAALSAPALDFFILITYCVGLLLVVFGAWSLFFAYRLLKGNGLARVYFMSQGLMLSTRTVFEAMYPVAVPEPRPEVLYQLAGLGLFFFLAAALPSRTTTA